jgi:hypothetical protein
VADTIWKYPLHITDRQEVRLPRYAEILSAGVAQRQLCIWARVSPVLAKAEPLEERIILVVGTGNPMHDDPRKNYIFIGTVVIPTNSMDLVWHIFEEKSR